MDKVDPAQFSIPASALSPSLLEGIENPILDKIMKEVIAEHNCDVRAQTVHDEFADFPEQ